MKPKYVDYMAKKAKALADAHGNDDFIQVKNKRKQNWSDSEDSVDSFRIPSSLGIKMKSKENVIKSSILEALNLFPQEKQAAILQGNLEILKELMAAENSAKSQSGWDRVTDLSLTCVQIDRDSYAYEDSKIASTFKEKRPVKVNYPAVIFVPNKVIVAVAFVKG